LAVLISGREDVIEQYGKIITLSSAGQYALAISTVWASPKVLSVNHGLRLNAFYWLFF